MAISLFTKREAAKGPRRFGLFNILLRRSVPIPPAILLLLLIFVWCSSTLVSVSFFHVCVSSRKLDLYCVSAGTRPEFGEFILQNNKRSGNGGSSSSVDDKNGSSGNNTSIVRNINSSSYNNNNNESTDYGGNNNNNGEAITIPGNYTTKGSSEDHNADQNNNHHHDENTGDHTTSTANGEILAAVNNNNSNHIENGNYSSIDFEAAVMSGHNNNDADAMKEELANALKDVKDQMKALRTSTSGRRNLSNQTTTCDGSGVFVYDLPPKFNQDLVDQCVDVLPWMNFCKYFTNNAMGEPIPKLGIGWYQTHQYSLEPIFHSRVLKHPCRVYKPNEAKLFYVPFYGGLHILRWHFKNVSSNVKDALGLDLIKWLEAQPTWIRHAGSDHVFVLGKISWDFRRNHDLSWGTNFLELNQMQNPFKLLIERQPWHSNDIGIPHPTHFHPHTDDDIIAWQSKIIKSDRKNLISFAGGARPEASENIRSILINQCQLSDGYCRFLDCNSGMCDEPELVIELFTESEFCLQPPGDSPTRKSVFDSLVSGCIPVLFDPFTAYYQYPWHLPEDYQRYSVFLDQEEVREMKVNVVERLKKVRWEEREAMRRYIVYELMPGLVYGDSDSQILKFEDAFTISIDNLIDRVNRRSEL